MQITKVIILLSALCMNAMAWTAYGAVADDIARYFPEQQITQLTVLDKQIPAVTLSSRHPLSRGVAIVLVDAESQSLNLDGGLILADTLTEKGWHCLLIPVERPAVTPSDTPDAPPKPIDNTTSMAPDYDSFYTSILGLTNAAYGYAQQHRGYTFVIAEGMTSAVLIDAFQRGALDMPDTLVSLGAFWPEHDKNQQLIDWLAQSSYPVLDLNMPMLSQWQSFTADARQTAAKVSLKRHYRQRQLFPTVGLGNAGASLPNPTGAWLGQEIYSWLRYLGW